MDGYVIGGLCVLVWTLFRMVWRFNVVLHGRPSRAPVTKCVWLDFLIHGGFSLSWICLLGYLGTFDGLRAFLRSVL